MTTKNQNQKTNKIFKNPKFPNTSTKTLTLKMFSIAHAQTLATRPCDNAIETSGVPAVFSPSVFGPVLARALDGLLAVQAYDAQFYASSPVETIALCGSLCLQPRGDGFYEADQLSRHYYTAGLTPVALNQIPGLADALGGLSVLDIRRMLRAQREARQGSLI